MTPGELSDALNELELTQTEFARFIGMSRRAVYRWTAGNDRVPPPVAALLRLMMAYPVTQAELIPLRSDVFYTRSNGPRG